MLSTIVHDTNTHTHRIQAMARQREREERVIVNKKGEGPNATVIIMPCHRQWIYISLSYKWMDMCIYVLFHCNFVVRFFRFILTKSK